jgi:hypothetical protein
MGGRSSSALKAPTYISPGQRPGNFLPYNDPRPVGAELNRSVPQMTFSEFEFVKL